MIGPFRRLASWFEALPIEDQLQRRHAVTLQWFSLVFVAGFLVVEGGRLAAGTTFKHPIPTLINLVNLSVNLIGAWQIRRGNFKRGSVIMVSGLAAVYTSTVAFLGLEFSRDLLKHLTIMLALAAFVVGRRGLWGLLFVLFIGMSVGFARDQYLLGGHGPRSAPSTPLSLLLISAMGFTILSLVLDRFGLTVREAFSDAVARQKQLEATTNELQAANRALAKEIEERRKVQARLTEAQKMEAIARLSGGVAHDFNNLLTAILGFGEMARDALPESEPARADVDEIIESARRGAALTRQLLAFARRQVLEPKVLHLGKRVQATEAMLRRLLGEDVELVTSCEEGLWPVKIDPGQLEQVVVNLAVNARDAMPKGGRLSVRSGNARVEQDRQVGPFELLAGDYVVLRVSDTGMGMDRETMVRVFEPFFTTKERGKGTGLGLATCQDIVHNAGGAIEVESEPGRGTTFSVFLPRTHELAEGIPTPLSTPVLRGGTETVLLVEDDPHLRQLACRALRERGYRVLDAVSGEEAALVTQSHRGGIALLVTDMVLPRGSGREVAQQVAAQWPQARILFVSGYTDDGQLLQGEREDGQHFLAKPFTPQELVRKVRTILDAPRA